MHEGLTRTVIGCGFEVINELGAGFLESVYERAMLVALSEAGLNAKSQVVVGVCFRGRQVGEFFADLLVEDKVIVELKCAASILPIHEAQVINYLKATGINVGLILNFGNPKMQFRR